MFPVRWLEDRGPRKMFEAIQLFRPTLLSFGSHLLLTMINAPKETSTNLDLSSVTMALPIGSLVPPDSNEKLKVHFPRMLVTFNIYAMAESGNGLTVSTTPRNMGCVAKGTELKLVNPETGRLCAAGETGEIFGRTKWAMKGYLNNPEENAKFFAEDGWFRTGDLAHYDNDLTLHFDGRLKEVIKLQYQYVYPNEVR